jgi:hypothetical protein
MYNPFNTLFYNHSPIRFLHPTGINTKHPRPQIRLRTRSWSCPTFRLEPEPHFVPSTRVCLTSVLIIRGTTVLTIRGTTVWFWMWQAHHIFRNLEWLKTHFSNSTSYFTNRPGLALHNVPDSYPFRRSCKSPTKSQLTTTTDPPKPRSALN